MNPGFEARSVAQLAGFRTALAVGCVFGCAAAVAQSQNTTTNYAYDAQGNLTTITNPDGQVTTQAFDALNRKVIVTQPIPATGARPQ